ncbi:hypothetical protein RUM43_011254 [Polyplax serrata]|uniref:Uncharacterized protein n=1 Tax=Polyplax serrata TaxID=468196 RepID=A0AAN8S052_POLSC
MSRSRVSGSQCQRLPIPQSLTSGTYDELVFCFHPEPVGRIKPRFPSSVDVLGFRGLADQSLTILCPAQGFPVPSIRGFPFHPSEPVGSTKPKLHSLDIIRIITESKRDFTMMCPAQGFPVPVYRGFRFRLLGLSFYLVKAQLSRGALSNKRNIYSEYFNHPYVGYFSISFAVEPLGSTMPTFVAEMKEPVGSTLPTFVSEVKRETRIQSGNEIAVLCPAQGFPVPAFR